ncbi:MAG TPA: methylated-DNA--[protein]-cysteine S-methyltransferase [Acidimicrobiales bacterium]|nr:methylated-DNA--[protein]-cysteine S-methyltransferase [Acidimicrobiales bacterium]
MGPEQRWAAVVARDAGTDGRFVYAVRTTRVYCRPACPARRPLRANVEFFDRASDAEAAGYRACRRCRPAAARTGAAEAVAEACRLLAGPGEAPPLVEVAREVGLSPSHLGRSFSRLVGTTPRRYAAGVRMDRARAGLRAGQAVTAAIYDAGFGSSRAFYEQAELGMPPAAYRAGAPAHVIRHTTVPSRLGPVLVAATDRGVCAVRFVDGEGEDELGQEFPAASIRRDDDGLRAVAERVVAAVEGRAGAADLPLDVRTTAFRLLVWEALRAIPAGQTRSYSEVAAAVGRPSAVRAVAGACAANPVAVLVPCHRAVAADGSLAGYRWGLERKRALLDAERGVTGPSVHDPEGTVQRT